MFKIDPDILVQVICRFGQDLQIRKAQEECQELIEALRDHLRRPTAETIDHVAEEIADVLIMTHQLAMIFSPSGVHHQVDKKMRRLKGCLALGGEVQINGKMKDEGAGHEISGHHEHSRGDSPRLSPR